MKAAVHTKYGPPEVVKVLEVEKPIPDDNEVLIKVFASTVNRTDCGFRSAEYFISRFWSGLLKPKYNTLGCEFAGLIEEVGKNVSLFKKGDKVFGYNDSRFGGHAEYLTINENNALSIIPQNINYETAAAITEGAHYALRDIRAAKVKPEQNVLVYGATGAIGSAAVQLLKYFETNVTAVCNTKSVDIVKSLGADTVIDFQTQDFTNTEQRFDFIFDAVGKSSFKKCKPILKEKGIYISTELGKNAENIFYALVTPLLGGKKVLFPLPTITKEDINFLKELVEAGKFRPVIDRKYSLEQIVEAYKYVETGQKTGNVVINVTQVDRLFG
ncbi:MAG: NAD(P)-dependent alcohol dehydrogenase [Ignavibacterium sp.]|nr:NAD(P)-dependent alcohol dehydrogenase [Ignavibacterium sp.]